MKALKIDVKNQIVYKIELSKDNFSQEVYDAIGNGCHTFCAPFDFANGDVLFADDTALLNDNVEGCFALSDFRYPIVGNAIIIGSDYDDDVCDVKTKPIDIIEVHGLIWGNKQTAKAHKEYVMNNSPIIIYENCEV
jgi:hypothetical protein